jgi:hypothetical protein
MQSSDAVAQAVTLLAPLAAKGTVIAQGVAVKVLGDMVAQRLQRDGQAKAWQDFRSNPQNDSLLRHLLEQALSQDAEFRGRFEAAVAEASRERPRAAGTNTINSSGPGTAQIGDNITGGRAATHGGSYHEGHNYNATRNRVTHKKGQAGVFVAIAVVAAVIVLAVVLVNALGSSQGSALTAGSTCQQFLNADDQTQQQALVNIALSKGIGGFGSPLALPEIQYECSSEPTMTMGAIVERDRNEF